LAAARGGEAFAAGFAAARRGEVLALALVFARAAFARVEGAGFAPAAVIDAVSDPEPRFELRRPGRDLGRLPSTPGSSLLSAATREK
jgi:hypothetical protein